MSSNYIVTLETQDVDRANEHFNLYDKDISIWSNTYGSFDYSKRVCILGESFFTISKSSSGWAYETRKEPEGVLISVALIGTVIWKGRHKSFQSVPGEAILLDRQGVLSANFEPGVSNKTIFLADVDIFRVLSILLGHPPKIRVFFKQHNGGQQVAMFVSNIVNSIVDFSTTAEGPIEGVTRGLKESLIAYILYSFDNNYSGILRDARATPLPTPYAIKRAAQLMMDCVDGELTIADVALQVGISTRSLQLGFKRFKNMTPMAFFRVTRLQKTHEILSDSSCTKHPKEISLEFGFTNYQLYVKYYSLMFGERPSDTARRNRA